MQMTQQEILQVIEEYESELVKQEKTLTEIGDKFSNQGKRHACAELSLHFIHIFNSK